MTKLYQLQLDQREVDCGMSYVYQLESGHFFLIDGGYFSAGEADRLYSFLHEQCGGKPVIEGWFFSHAHQDHIGVFLDMLETHHQDVEIRSLIFNFQPLDLPETSEGWRIKSNDLATVKRFYEMLEKYCANIPVRTPRTGDTWQLGELTLEVLFTHEDLDVPTTFNDHSTVLRVDAKGQSVLFLGDVYLEGSRIMLNEKAEKLPCDIVQVSHHGFNGAPKELYQAIDASVALWPQADYCIESNRNREANRYLLDESGVREHIISGLGTRCLELPYTPVAKA